jgi:hypothetical protein
MKTRYRLIEKFYQDEGWFQGWFPWGILYENVSGMFTDRKVIILSFPDDDRQTARHMGQRIVDLEIDIESQIELVDVSYPIRFRVLTAIHWVEGEDYRAIRQRLWDALFDAMRAREANKERPSAAPIYAAQPTYHVTRETADLSPEVNGEGEGPIQASASESQGDGD